MSDEILRSVFQEGSPLSERERFLRRSAAVFALVTFDENFAQPAQQARLGVQLGGEQIRIALEFASANPHYEPNPERPIVDFIWIGYEGLADEVRYVIPAALATESTDVTISEYARGLMDQDPSGITMLRRNLARYYEMATDDVFTNADKTSDVEIQYVRDDKDIKRRKEEEMENIMKKFRAALCQDLGTESLTPKDEDLLRAVQHTFISPHLEDTLKKGNRYQLFEETGLIPNEHGHPVPSYTLQARGAQMAFDRYQAAVNLFFAI